MELKFNISKMHAEEHEKIRAKLEEVMAAEDYAELQHQRQVEKRKQKMEKLRKQMEEVAEDYSKTKAELEEISENLEKQQALNKRIEEVRWGHPFLFFWLVSNFYFSGN